MRHVIHRATGVARGRCTQQYSIANRICVCKYLYIYIYIYICMYIWAIPCTEQLAAHEEAVLWTLRLQTQHIYVYMNMYIYLYIHMSHAIHRASGVAWEGCALQCSSANIYIYTKSIYIHLRICIFMLHKYEWVTSCTEELVVHEGAALSNILLQKEAEARRLQVRISKAQVYCICVLHCVAMCSVCALLRYIAFVCCSVVQCVAVWCNVLQCGAMCCSVRITEAQVYCICVLQCGAMYCNVLQCGVMCCSVALPRLRYVTLCVAVCCSMV